MAFKRSAVRSRLSPPITRVTQESRFFGNEILVLCCNCYDVHSKAKLLQVDVEVDVQFVVPVDLHPFNQAVDNHFFRFQVCLVIHIRPGDYVLVLCVESI